MSLKRYWYFTQFYNYFVVLSQSTLVYALLIHSFFTVALSACRDKICHNPEIEAYRLVQEIRENAEKVSAQKRKAKQNMER